MFYAAFAIRRIHHEGDERSRTNPGHGYPEHWEEVTDVVRFKSEEEMKKWAVSHQGERYEIVRCEPVKVKIEAVVTATVE